MKTCPSARPGSRKPKKGVQNAPKHESAISTQEYHSALSKCQMAPFWPDSFCVMIRHILFDFFVEKHISMRILPVVAYFLSISASINRDWISKFKTLFYTLKRDTFSHTRNSHIFEIPLWYSLKPGFLGFKDNCINFFEP